MEGSVRVKFSYLAPGLNIAGSGGSGKRRSLCGGEASMEGCVVTSTGRRGFVGGRGGGLNVCALPFLC